MPYDPRLGYDPDSVAGYEELPPIFVTPDPEPAPPAGWQSPPAGMFDPNLPFQLEGGAGYTPQPAAPELRDLAFANAAYRAPNAGQAGGGANQGFGAPMVAPWTPAPAPVAQAPIAAAPAARPPAYAPSPAEWNRAFDEALYRPGNTAAGAGQWSAEPAATPAVPAAVPRTPPLSPARPAATPAMSEAPPSLASDMFWSGAGGLASGAANTLAFAEWLTEVPDRARDWVLEHALPADAAERYSNYDGSKARARNEAARVKFAQDHGLPFGLSAADFARWVDSQIYQPQTTAGGYAKSIGEFLPGMVVPGKGHPLYRLTTDVLIPALTSEEFARQFKGTQFEPYARIVGSILGTLLGKKVVDRAVTPLPASAERKEMGDLLASKNVDFSGGQQAGNNTLRKVEGEFSPSANAALMQRQREQFGEATLSLLGAPKGTRADIPGLKRARGAIDQSFGDLASRHAIWGDRGLGAGVRNAMAPYIHRSPGGGSEIIKGLAARVEALEGTRRSGGEYLALRSRLNDELGQFAGDPAATKVLTAMKTALDEAMERGIRGVNQADASAWRQARAQDYNLGVIEKALDDKARGGIDPAALYQSVSGPGRPAFAQDDDLLALAKAGDTILTPAQPARNLHNATGNAVGAAIGVGIGRLMGDAAGAMVGAGAGAIAPSLIGQALLSSPGRVYLRNQLLANPKAFTPLQRTLLASVLANDWAPPRQ